MSFLDVNNLLQISCRLFSFFERNNRRCLWDVFFSFTSTFLPTQMTMTLTNDVLAVIGDHVTNHLRSVGLTAEWKSVGGNGEKREPSKVAKGYKLLLALNNSLLVSSGGTEYITMRIDDAFLIVTAYRYFKKYDLNVVESIDGIANDVEKHLRMFYAQFDDPFNKLGRKK